MLCYRTAIKRANIVLGAKSMNWLKFAAAAAAISLVAAPGAAQYASDGAAFVEAVRKSDGSAAKKILEERGPAIINTRDYEGNTALVVAINNRDEDWTAFLLQQGADPNLASKGGETPLIAASRIGYDDAVGWLLGLNVKVDAANKMGETALIIAVQQRHPRIVRALLAAGANPDKTDAAAGLSARDYAKRDTRSREILQLIEARKITAADGGDTSR